MNEHEQSIFLKDFFTEKIRLKNRFVMAPVPTGFVTDRIPMKENISFYGKRANSVGLIIAGAININHHTAPNHVKTPNIETYEQISSWKRITDEVHLNGGKIVAQIWHSGGYRKICLPEDEVTTPSGIIKGEVVGKPVSKEEIKEIVSRFAETAYNVKRAGFDGVEIHAAHGGLIHDFFSNDTNKRTDEYGFFNRTLFAEDIIKSCRKVVGDSFPILLRISNFKMYDSSSRLATTPEELQGILYPLVKAGIDIFDCSSLRFTDNAFADYEGCLAFWTKKICQKPTINVGCVGSKYPFINDASKIIDELSNRNDDMNSYSTNGNGTTMYHKRMLLNALKNEEYDLIALGRPLLLDAEWVDKI